MELNALERIRVHPDFPRLIRRKQRLAWSLTGTMLATYYGFVLLMAFAPQVLAIPLGGRINLGIVTAAGLIVLSFALTAWYVHASNRTFDPLLDTIRRECGQ